MAPSVEDFATMMRQAKNYAWKYTTRSLPTVAEGTVQLVSDVYDVAAAFGGYSQLGSQVDAINVLADEFAVTIHWTAPDGGAVPNPVLTDPAIFMVETVNPGDQPDGFGTAPRFVAVLPGENVAGALNASGDPGPPAELGGFSTIYTPGVRIVRFRLRLSTVTFAAGFKLIMQVTARLRSPHLLWEMLMLQRSIERSEREKLAVDKDLAAMFKQATFLQPAGLRR